MSPEERRDVAVSEAINVGASIQAVIPMAHPDTPHVVAAYKIMFGAPDLSVLAALGSVRAETELEVAGLVPWIEEYSDPLEEPYVRDEAAYHSQPDLE